MIQIAVQDILQAVPTLEKISQEQFNGSVAFQIGRVLRELDKEIKSFEETRKKLIENYAERDEAGEIKINNDNVVIRSDKVQTYNKEITDVLNTLVEINVNTLPLSCLESVQLTPQEALALEALFE